MAEANDRPTLPPYLPYRTFKGYLDGLKMSGIPAKIDRSILRNRSGTEQAMLINTLQYLGLIRTDGTPTEALVDLVGEEGEERQKRLRTVLMLRYPLLFDNAAFNLRTATPAMIQGLFHEIGVTGDTVRKAVAFFLAAAAEAGVEVSPYLKVRAPRGASQRRKRGAAPNGNGEDTPRATTPRIEQKPQSAYDALIGILDPNTMDEKELEAVWVLIRYLKKREIE